MRIRASEDQHCVAVSPCQTLNHRPANLLYTEEARLSEFPAGHGRTARP